MGYFSLVRGSAINGAITRLQAGVLTEQQLMERSRRALEDPDRGSSTGGWARIRRCRASPSHLASRARNRHCASFPKSQITSFERFRSKLAIHRRYTKRRFLCLHYCYLQVITVRPAPCNNKVIQSVSALSRRKHGFKSRQGRQQNQVLARTPVPDAVRSTVRSCLRVSKRSTFLCAICFSSDIASS